MFSIQNTIPVWKKKAYKFFFINRRSDANFFYFFRVSIGLFCLIHFLSILNDFNLLYSRNGLVDLDVMNISKPRFIPNLTMITDFAEGIFKISEHSTIIFFIGLYIALCICITVGFLSRVSSILLLAFHLILVKGTPLYSYGVDYFTTIALFYCCVFPIGSNKSLDRYFFKVKNTNPSPYRKILQLHLCIVYFSSGIAKIIGSAWRSGESIWKSVHLPMFDPIMKIDYSFMASYPFIAIISGWAVIIIELVYIFLVWKNPYKNPMLLFVVLMHAGIFICLGLYFFSTLMIILSLTAFLDLNEKRQLSTN